MPPLWALLACCDKESTVWHTAYLIFVESVNDKQLVLWPECMDELAKNKPLLLAFSMSQDKALFKPKTNDIFLISPQKHMLWYLLEVPLWGASNEYPQRMFWGEIKYLFDYSFEAVFSSQHDFQRNGSYFSTKTCCGYSLEVPQRGNSNEYPQHMFCGEIRKILIWLLLLSGVIFSMKQAFPWNGPETVSKIDIDKVQDC